MILVILAVVLFGTGRAQAHAAFVSADPEPGSELGTAPGVVVLDFTESLNTKLSRASVIAPDGRRFDGTATAGAAIRIPLSTNAQGVYEVDWTTVSTVDGHTLSGSFRFGVGVSPGAGAEGSTSSGPRGVDLLLAIARAVEDVALLLALGMIVVGRLARRRPLLDWVRTRLPAALAIALVGGIAVVVGEALEAAPSPSVGAVTTYLTTGLAGTARLARPLLEAVALAISFVSTGWTFAPLAAALIAMAGAGHAAAIHPRWWGITVDAVHLLSAGVWAGGILALATLRPPDGWRGSNGRALLDRFTPVALTAFAVTVGAGLVRGIQEVGSFRELFMTSYGIVLLAKGVGILIMAQLSFLAWRRIIGSLRAEAAVVVLVIGASALLAAFPLPPARVAEAESSAAGLAAGSALPKGGELTLGGHAGEVLVGLTLRPGTPGQNDVLVYLLPLDGPQAAARLGAELTVGDRPVPIRECGPTCRNGRVDLRGSERIEVRVEGTKGGTATFQLPALPAPGGSQLLQEMMVRIHQLKTYRLDETLSSGEAVVRATYAFQAPNRYESTVTETGGGSQTVEIGGTRYLKPSGHPWEIERGGPPPRIPWFIWDFFRPFIDARVIGSGMVDGTPTQIVAFFGDRGGTPVWFRLWVDSGGLVLRAEMRAQGHFMDHRYYDFDAPISIKPPRTSPGG